ncbi:MAG: aspartate aminotransferase family protein [Candidatus Eremiobacteraeota bacterium]|nr:aspartate aminotransferase family protein [Candidatus Eremiobacteraeota bacterium]
MNDDLEHIASQVPGPKSVALLGTLQTYESRNVTYVAGDFPVVWDSATGALVTDVDGNRYIDLTAAFGVANAGHSNPRVTAAIAAQATRLMHGMGDVFPTEIRTRLLQRLPQRLPSGLEVAFLASTGSEAVEAAIKTAVLVTGKTRFASFRNAYHGLSMGALSVSGIARFRDPFAAALGPPAVELPYPRDGTIDARTALARIRSELSAHSDLAAVVVEPIQGRGGCVVPPSGFLAGLRSLCDELRILLVADEIFTGFGRTGRWFAVEHEDVVPDLICIGKAMGSGFPISALAGKRDVMDAWPPSIGEALHTSTYLGNPMACAAALATLDELERHELPARAARLGVELGGRLKALRQRAGVVDVRGRGLLWGIQLRDGAAADVVVKRALAKGVIVLQSGPEGDTISLSPPLVISQRQLERAVDILEGEIS